MIIGSVVSLSNIPKRIEGVVLEDDEGVKRTVTIELESVFNNAGLDYVTEDGSMYLSISYTVV